MFANFEINIGARVIKTAVSAAIAMLITESLGLAFPSLAVVAAIITLQPTFHETLESSASRILGTLIGTIMALPCVYIFHIDASIEVFFGVLVILTLSNALSLTTSSVLGVIAYVSIVTQYDANFMSMLDTLVSTIIGIGTSLVINAFTPVQSVAEKTENIINRALIHDIKLLSQSLGIILNNEAHEQNDLRKLTNEIIGEMNEAYAAGTLLKREQRFANDYESYRKFDQKYSALWIIHNSALQVQIDKDIFKENGFTIMDSVAEQLQKIMQIFAEILLAEEVVPKGTGYKIKHCLEEIEKILTDFFEPAHYGSINEERSSYTILLSNLKRFADNIEIFEIKERKNSGSEK